jgi:biopolymer transport protein TolR
MGAKLAGRARGGMRHRQGVMSEINVTPLVDVMLVLLVIFMVTAPLLTAGVQLNLPKAKAGAISQSDDAPLEIQVDAHGTLFLGDQRVSLDDLQTKLLAIAGETAKDRRIYVRADAKIDYGRVASVMAAVTTAGFTKVALVTDPTHSE